MPDIKTRDSLRTVKTLDRAKNLAGKVRVGAERVRTTAEESQNRSYGSETEYAGNAVQSAEKELTVQAFSKAEKIGEWGIKETGNNIRKHLSEMERKTESGEAWTEYEAKAPERKEVSTVHCNTEKTHNEPLTKTSKKYSDGRENTARKPKTSEKSGFSSKTIKTAEQSGKTVKTTAASSGKTAKQTAETTAKTTKKAAEETGKAAKKAAETAKKVAEETAKAVKEGAKAVVEVGKAVVSAVKGIVAAIAAGGWVAVVVIVLVCIIALVLGSVLAYLLLKTLLQPESR